MTRGGVKNKIYFGSMVLLVMCVSMFGYVFKKLSASNQVLIEQLNVSKKEEAKLKDEQESFIRAQNDLAKLARESIKPQNFFSQDISLVKEIERLEQIAGNVGVTMTLTGISGTLKTATKATTRSEIYQIPYNLRLEGSLDGVVAFMEYLENLEYITSVGTVGLSTSDNLSVIANLTANFYLTK
jgi:hypothetical protein